MTRKPNYLESIENYFDDSQTLAMRMEFEAELQSNPELMEEFQLQKEIEEAILEKDVHHLRHQLQQLIRTKKSENKFSQASFDLTDELDLPSILSDSLESADLSTDTLENFESLPKIHLYNHTRAQKETVHQFYKEQEQFKRSADDLNTDLDMDAEWAELENAVLEKDIMELRESLQHIAASMSSHKYSVEEIEQYLEGNLHGEDLELFEEELAVNSSLNTDVEINMELEEAITETDIMDLRDKISLITQKQSSITRSVEEIESYLDGELDESDTESFAEELYENIDLQAEVNLLRELNAALTENDVMNLRNELAQVKKEVKTQEEKSIFSINSHTLVKKWGTAAAVLITALMISSVVNFSSGTRENIYQKFYSAPAAVTQFRSATQETTNFLMEGFDLYNKSEFASALSYFQKVLETDQNNPAARFYSGASLQSLEKYNNAAEQYNQVLLHHDNIFLEQAEWYLSLCYLKLGETEKSIKQLEAVVNRNGFYQKKAKELLKQINRSKS